MQMGGAIPETFASVSCMRNTSLSRSEKSLVLASVRGNSEIAATTRRTRRLFGSCAGAARQGVLEATDVEVNPIYDDYADWVAYRQAEKRKEKTDGAGAGKVKRGVRILSGIN